MTGKEKERGMRRVMDKEREKERKRKRKRSKKGRGGRNKNRKHGGIRQRVFYMRRGFTRAQRDKKGKG
jgi:hypothetical protein